MRCLSFPLGLTYTLWPLFEKGEASCLRVLAGVNHCCRCKFESLQPFVASGGFVLRCHHENRPPTLCTGSTSCFSPSDRHLCGLLWTVSVHIAPSLFPAAALVPLTLRFLHFSCFRHAMLNVEASWKYGSSIGRNILNFFHSSSLTKNIRSPNYTRQITIWWMQRMDSNKEIQPATIRNLLLKCSSSCGISWDMIFDTSEIKPITLIHLVVLDGETSS